MDYDQFNVKTFCSTDKGIAVVTKDNKVFYNGNFWSGKAKNENIETGVKELDVEGNFEGEICEIGG